MEAFITEIGTVLKGILKEIWSFLAEMIPRAIKFLIWLFAGMIILPCMYVAGHLYPKWMDWGDNF